MRPLLLLLPCHLLLLQPPSSLATYRMVALQELCKQQQPPKVQRVTLEDGGAAIISLGQGEVSTPFWRCDLEVRAGPGQGLLVMVEQAALRTGPGARCHDYLQLGRDDATPFFTWDKTAALCGEAAAGTSYDIPTGRLLVWLRLGALEGRQGALVGLVVTSYLREDSTDLTHYRPCAKGGVFIRRGFFCDGRVNCATDRVPADESTVSCGSGNDGVTPPAPPLPGPHLNLLTVTLVLVSAALLLLALLVLAVRLRRSHCCLPSPPPPELPDRHAPMLPPRPRPHTLLNTARGALQHTEHSPDGGTTPDSESEPPPAYCDLYPTGFTFEEEKPPEIPLNPPEICEQEQSQELEQEQELASTSAQQSSTALASTEKAQSHRDIN